ncbi:MAG: pantetheine-phosphate adenylyltransferase [Bacteroidales bacterium]|nr:pantetheine-phosphate adenylyltransferase [Bacteroidales bacterium]MCB9013374.1 pantetheine-phosphate adenylyltransferase [Bacteroidales bacterium]
MEKIALFPGSFDPFTIGHQSIVNRALPLFDKIIIAIGYNTLKKPLLELEKRMQLISDVFPSNPKIVVSHYQGLTIEYCTKVKANYLLRGLRTAADFEYERAIGQMNKAMNPGIESVFLLTAPEHSFVNSTIVRDILFYGGDASKFLPEGIDIKKYLS